MALKIKKVYNCICNNTRCRFIGDYNDIDKRVCDSCGCADDSDPDGICPDCGKSPWWLPVCPACGDVCNFVYGDLKSRIREKQHWSKPVGRG